MDKYTQQDLDNFPIIVGRKQYPTGDYSEIKVFPDNCDFGARSTFGPDSIFGAGSTFGPDSRFGAFSHFGHGSRFGAFSRFGHGSRFDAFSRFGHGSRFEGHKARTDNPFIAIKRAGSESRKTYFFDFVDGLHVRSGCFFGTAEEFREKVLEDVPKDSKKAKQYLGMLEIAKITFGID